MWPGLVGKEEGSDEPPIALNTMLDLTSSAQAPGGGYDGVDLFLYYPHLNIDANEHEIKKLADRLVSNNLRAGTLAAPIWTNTGGGSAMGSNEDRKNFVAAVKKSCRYANILRDHGARTYGSIRIDSATDVTAWAKDPATHTRIIAETFQECGRIAERAGVLVCLPDDDR